MWITVQKVVGNRVQVGIDAPNSKSIRREANPWSNARLQRWDRPYAEQDDPPSI